MYGHPPQLGRIAARKNAPQAGAAADTTGGNAMNLTQLKAIVLIDLHHSLSKAAAKLFITQASLSISIKKLEEEIDCALLERSAHGVTLTRKGREILEHAKIICSAVNEIYRIGQREESRLAVDVSVGVSSYLCNLLAIRAMLTMRTSQENPTSRSMT